MKQEILIVSDGENEDIIACALIDLIRREKRMAKIKAIALSGDGACFLENGIELLAPVLEERAVPEDSEDVGLIKQPKKEIGLFNYFSILRNQKTNYSLIIGIGSLKTVVLPGFIFNCPIGFVCTKRSDLYAPVPPAFSGLETWFMRKKCSFVFTFENMTANSLQKAGVNAFFDGNCFMDIFEESAEKVIVAPDREIIGLSLALGENDWLAFPNLLMLVEMASEKGKFEFLLDLPLTASLEKVAQCLENTEWEMVEPHLNARNKGLAARLVFGDKVEIKLLQGKIGDIIALSRIVISDNELALLWGAGYGRPLIAFSNDQEMLKRTKCFLGEAVKTVQDHIQQVSDYMVEICGDPWLYQDMRDAGLDKISSGALQRIVEKVMEVMDTNDEGKPFTIDGGGFAV